MQRTACSHRHMVFQSGLQEQGNETPSLTSVGEALGMYSETLLSIVADTELELSRSVVDGVS